MGRTIRQKLQSHYTSTMIVNFYLDPRFETELLGKLELVEITEESDNSKSFIIEEMPEHKQEVYSLEKWLGQVIELTDLGEQYYNEGELIERDFKVLFCIGPCPTSAVSLKHLENRSSSNIVDRFIVINGIEIY